MGKVHQPTTSEIIVARATLSGRKVPDLVKITGIPESTIYKRLREPDTWRLGELAAVNKYIHFTADDLQMMLQER